MKIFTLFILTLLFVANTNGQETPEKWRRIFESKNAKGTFVLYNFNTKNIKYYNRVRADSSYLPASTFKVLNSLIALESKVIKDENEFIKWDGIDKGWSKWNKDQNMKSAIALSCVWFYQELARKIGQARMQNWITKIKYGNRQMGGKIDNFWLSGNLRISANEQVRFLEQFVNGTLPFQRKDIETVKRIMITDSTDTYIIHSKTGWSKQGNKQIGWFIGYVEKENNKWIFAMNIDIVNKSDLKLRKEITYDILKCEKIIN